MTLLIQILTLVYLLCTVGLAVFTASIWVLLVLWLIHHRKSPPLPQISAEQLPTVTLQLPIYNERDVIFRLLDAVAALDYPRDRLQVQVLDDSDDDTADLVARLVAVHRAAGMNISHIRRPERAEYKAGALAYALERVESDLIAIFDADFAPSPDFLRKTAPYFVTDPNLGILQCRWGHLNAPENLITRCQAISVDGHFVVEQTARNRGHLLLSFNGTGGLWRAKAIRDAGGWSGRTLAEDLDLSYRAQMRGWKYLYLPEIEVPAELPPQILAYKRQQARWAKGTTQNLIHQVTDVWRQQHLSLFQKFMATLHLCQYLPQPVLLMMGVLTPPLLLAGVMNKMPLSPLGILGLGSPIMYLVSQIVLYRDWWKRLIAFLPLLAVGTGVIFNNSVAVAEAFLGRPSVFKRTPKFAGRAWQDSRYALQADWTTLGEALLAVYLFFGALIAMRAFPAIAPFLVMQTIGFAAMVFWSLSERFRMRR
jgi:cellulose synthase/poly-beta-1,6-N-acetylglucosamine synthase-like glycosyltransferase